MSIQRKRMSMMIKEHDNVRFTRASVAAWICITLVLLNACGSSNATSGAAEHTAVPVADPPLPHATSAAQLPTNGSLTATGAVPTTIGQATVDVTPSRATVGAPAATESPLATPAPSEQALVPEQSPPGDIPDSQVFVVYTSSDGGYALDVPEGWARTDVGSGVRFLHTFDGLSVTLQHADSAPTVATATMREGAALLANGRAVTIDTIEAVTLPGGSAVHLVGSANSDPDPVTNKQVRLEQQTYLFYHAGTEAFLTVWAPLGADNVDQWNRIAQSFRWK